MNPKVAIVILNWNGRKYLQEFLPSVVASSYNNLEIIVADNASTDDSIAFVRQTYPQINIITLTSNLGFAKGYNEALKQVKAEYFILLNSDVQVHTGWIEPIIDVMENNPQVAVCQPKILMFAEKNRFEYAGAAGGWLDYLGYPFARGRVFDYCEEDYGQYDDNAMIFWASGAAMFVRSKVFNETGGLDEYFFAHQEEIDLCWRIQLAGYQIMAVPASRVFHVGGGTLPKGNERKVFLNFRNNMIMLAKNLPFSEAAWKIPFRIILDAISAWKSLFAGETTYFVAVFDAHVGFFKWLVLGRKRSVFPLKKEVTLSGLYNQSIVWKHFILRKTTFREIIGDKD